MSREIGSQTVLLFLELVNAGVLDTALAHVSEGAELDWSGSEAIDRGTYRGRAAWRSWFSERKHDIGELRFETTEVLEPRPGTVVTVNRLRGRGRASGLEVAALGAGVWTLGGACITSATMYQTREEALAAAEAQE
jgi:ketosteroid isomerase-like protein